MRWLIVLVLALALGGTACGGGDEATGDTTTVATETMTDETTDETTTDETTTDTVTDFPGLASDDCLALVTAIATLGAAFVAPVSGDTADTSEFFDRFDAPEEIQADFATLAEAYAAYGAALQDIGLEAGQTPSAEQLQQYQQALASIDQPGVAEASERISAWTEQNCSSGWAELVANEGVGPDPWSLTPSQFLVRQAPSAKHGDCPDAGTVPSGRVAAWGLSPSALRNGAADCMHLQLPGRAGREGLERLGLPCALACRLTLGDRHPVASRPAHLDSSAQHLLPGRAGRGHRLRARGILSGLGQDLLATADPGSALRADRAGGNLSCGEVHAQERAVPHLGGRHRVRTQLCARYRAGLELDGSDARAWERRHRGDARPAHSDEERKRGDGRGGRWRLESTFEHAGLLRMSRFRLPKVPRGERNVRTPA